jgi:hypothetical protein
MAARPFPDAADDAVATAHATVSHDDDIAMVLLMQLVAVSLPDTSQAQPQAVQEVERPPGHGYNLTVSEVGVKATL